MGDEGDIEIKSSRNLEYYVPQDAEGILGRWNDHGRQAALDSVAYIDLL
jgi:hypothetical protein